MPREPSYQNLDGLGRTVTVEEFAPFYDFALRRIDIESKGGILCNLLLLLIGGQGGN
jgi:hypothetical protein